MDTNRLKRFAQYARRELLQTVTTKLEMVLDKESAARREKPRAIEDLEKAIKELGKERVIDQVAYTWFNRFCALRFMDVKGYNRIRVVSPLENQFQPEILAEAKMGHLGDEVVSEKLRERILALLAGTFSSRDPQTEAYRLLIVAICNEYHRSMPFLFERIDDYTELLMPDDLLSGNSILAYTREAMTPENCESVEVIGWLYQFYISEKKEDVFKQLKKGKKIGSESIPAATQLFTPSWIVRYLVENSLGRLWMLNRPQSKLVEKMEYYIRPEQVETDFLRVSSPEDLKVCDPACGSGHMLVYAFDLLYAIYEEEGYEPSEIPEKILTDNLYGIEIDKRAGELAAFALLMKARGRYRRFLRKPVQPNIAVLEPIAFEEGELSAYLDFVDRDLFTTALLEALHQFKEADNFGALIRPVVTDVAGMLGILKGKDAAGQLLLYKTHEKVLQVLKQADYLSPKYQVVIANPPYMGNKGMNDRLKAFLQDNYKDYKADLFAVFTVRCLDLCKNQGFTGFMTPFVWMFLSSYENLRSYILNNFTLTSLVKPSYTAFFDSAIVAICTYTIHKNHDDNYKGTFFDLDYLGTAEEQSPRFLQRKKDKQYYQVAASDFKKIPGSAIAYWVSKSIIRAFSEGKPLYEIATPRAGMITGNNDIFVRLFHEVSLNNFISSCLNREEAKQSQRRWFPYQKGGPFRKYFGNLEYVINWEDDGHKLRTTKNSVGKIPAHAFNENYIFKANVNWSAISSSNFSTRITNYGCLFDASGSAAFPNQLDDVYILSSFLNSPIARIMIGAINPTLNFQAWEIGSLPILVSTLEKSRNIINKNTKNLRDFGKTDWDSYETSWDFTQLPLISYQSSIINEQKNSDCSIDKFLSEQYQNIRQQWAEMTLKMQRLEEENNRIFIEAYGLQDELTPEVPLKEITLTCNPHYRYNADKSQEELEALLLADTMREFISYAVGCIFGRYSLDKPGLILANQGETIDDYLAQIPEPSFMPDRDNVIPILDGDWFNDDIIEKFRQFLTLTFGKENYQTNLQFIENALGKTIQKYFLKDFYSDHIKRYKKRPIYWLFSSPKGNFNALIYLHRYRPDTVSIVLNDYLREYRAKLTAKVENLQRIEISANASPTEKTKAIKEIEKLNKIIKELGDYETEILYPLAIQQINIDLDEGVKINYGKFGQALKKIPGLEDA
jgi:type II restriction/modification system DNA methylase subunit YeeA